MKHSTIWDKKSLRFGISAVFWLVVWQITSLCAPQILFASPWSTLQALVRLGVQPDFWLSIGNTLLMTTCGFVLAFVLGSLCAIGSHSSVLLRALLEPAIQGMKSVPVACFAVVALIWVRSSYISVLVSFFVVLPVTYVSMLAALTAIDRELAEVMVVFRVPRGKRVRMFYLPQLLPGVLAGCRISVGMCWKASIAGEIIGLPARTVGESLYLAKLYIAFDALFAWTIVIVLVSMLLEKLVAHVLRTAQLRLEGDYGYQDS